MAARTSTDLWVGTISADPHVLLLTVTDIEIRPSRYGAPMARSLVQAAVADLVNRYGGAGDDTPVDALEFDPPEGCFLVALLDGEPVGCGGWRVLGGASDPERSDGPEPGKDVAEIKRMYTSPSARGRGVASALLQALEDSARAAGMRRMVLETGGRNPEAIAFYAKVGYERIENYGFYKDEPDCVSFGRDL